MKKILQFHVFFALLTFCILPACTKKEKGKQNITIIMDVTQKYPTKKMLLQDIAEVEYLPLETSDEFLWKGSVEAFTDRYILNYNHITGDILFFDRNGKALKQINRKGSSGEEYSNYCEILLDEENNELFVNDRNQRKIFVYDPDGNFKRILVYIPEKTYTNVALYDKDRLIAYNRVNDDTIDNSYLIISKTTGKAEHEWTISPTGRKLSDRHTEGEGEETFSIQFQSFPLTPAYPDFILNDISNDTIFSMNPAMELRPIAIQYPSRPTMNTEVFMFYAMGSKDFLFFYNIEKKVDRQTFKAKQWNLVYDKNEQEIYEQDIYNADFTSDKKVTIYNQTTQFSANNQKVFLDTLEATDLIEAYENNQLQGPLKEIAKGLQEDDNPVLMIVRFK